MYAKVKMLIDSKQIDLLNGLMPTIFSECSSEEIAPILGLFTKAYFDSKELCAVIRKDAKRIFAALDALSPKPEKYKFEGKYNGYFSGKALRVAIEQLCILKGFTCSVTKEHHNAIRIKVKKAPKKYEAYFLGYPAMIEQVKKEYPEQKHDYRFIDRVANYTLKEKGIIETDICGDVEDIANCFNFNNSDSMTDYFRVGFYCSVSTVDDIVFVDNKAGTANAKPQAKSEEKKEETPPINEGEILKSFLELEQQNFTIQQKEKYFLFGGDTISHKEFLKEKFAARWNWSEKAWMIFNSHLEMIKEIFGFNNSL